MASSDPPTELIDLAKLRGALDVLRRSFAAGGRQLPFAPEHLVMEQALIDYGCFGHWPDLGPLVRGLRNYGAYLGQSDQQTFADFDAFLDWILDQSPGPERKRGSR
mgnify:CR=1 FL=1